MNRTRIIGLALGPIIFFTLLLAPVPEGLSPAAMTVAAVAALMATWWISEAIPIPATALIPIVLFPFLGVMPTIEVTVAYSNHLIYLFMGGFLIAVTIERWNLHRRIALHTVNLIGSTPEKILLGFMLATAFLSMWISNTAAAMMMVTIGLAVLRQQDLLFGAEDSKSTPFSCALMLGIAYSASIGGIGTIIGTPPNAILVGLLEKNYQTSISFLDWMRMALPLSLTMLFITWFYLSRRFALPQTTNALGKQQIQQAISTIGVMTIQERRVLWVFLFVAGAWIFRGLVEIEQLQLVSDASIAMFGAILLFVIPSGDENRQPLLDWQTAVKIPWDIIILFGGGFALAEGFVSTGLTQWIAQQLVFLQGIDIVLMIGTIALLVVFLTEVTSNTATASLLLPVMAALATAMNIHPLFTMLAVVIAASFAFMLPVATPPNAIVFASRAVTVAQMAKTGIVLNVISVVLISLYVVYIIPLLFDFPTLG